MSGKTGTFGVLGLGSIGTRHARNLLALGQAVVGLDPDPERGRALIAAGGRVAETREALFAAGRAGVVIASPSDRHRDDLADAVAWGRPVLVEKPLAHTLEGVDAVLTEAERRGLVVFAGLNLRCHPTVCRAARSLHEGEIGAPLWARFLFSDYLPNWRPGRDHRAGYAADPRTGGVLFDLVHEVDLANLLLGPGEAVAAAARSSGRIGITADDCADLFLRHRDGVISSLHLDLISRPRRRVCEIAGSHGQLRLDLDARRLERFATDGTVTAFAADGSYADDYLEEMRCFLACLDGAARPPCDGRTAFEVLKQVIAARQLAGLPST